MIDANTYRATCHLKEAQMFSIFMRDIQYQVERKARAQTNTESVIPQECHDFPNVFPKIDSSTLFSHGKYDYKIYLEKQQTGYALLYKISSKELDAVKQYFDSYLVERFI